MKFVFKMLFLVSAVGSMATQAVESSLPQHCDYGRVKQYDVQVTQVTSAIESGFQLYGSPYSPQAWGQFAYSLGSLLNSFDYLRIQAPSHVLQGSPFTFKGNLFDPFAYVNFHTSEKGYVGRDKSSIEANAYYQTSFDQTYGYGLAWITRGNLCSAQGVWVQKLPDFQLVSLTYGRAVIKVNIDQFSRAAKDPAVRSKITLRGFAQEGSQIEHYPLSFDQLTGNITVNFSSDYFGTNFKIYATIDDGTYTQVKYIGTVTGGVGHHQPCPTCHTDI
ncbi:hypothetical protein [Rheinheimera pacifica]|uniref:hypothetical protein n=1 Tax=Rheinheimera pacifica TaxID=173990 RepID=UPI002ED988D8